MPENSTFAYTLRQLENGWRWSVYDENGDVVADGAQSSRAAAQAAVERTMRAGPGQDSVQAA